MHTKRQNPRISDNLNQLFAHACSKRKPRRAIDKMDEEEE